MAERNFAEEINNIPETNTLTGNKEKSHQLYYQLVKSFETADSVDIIVSFLMESGVKLLINRIKQAVARGARIRILTGTYLNITQPEAIALLKRECGNKIDLRFYIPDGNQSFHPKAYIFHNNNASDIFIGSSNISYSALTSGIEWNYRFNSIQHKDDYEFFYNTFQDLFLNHSVPVTDKELKAYAKNWHKPSVMKDLEKAADFSPFTQHDMTAREATNVYYMYEPRGAQIEALYALENSRAEGADKGLVYAATGVGKTYLAAFDSKNYKTVLFVAHQEELLKQAAESFHNIRPNDEIGFFYGKVHDTVSDNNPKHLVFASVQSLGKPEYLNANNFPPDYFEYIVIDEFHHAVNKQYLNIINYFKPKFLLGLTATPERTDGRNIYALCDYNVPFEISLFQSINRGLLVPFHYYGIYDQTDYSTLRFSKGDYIEEDLNNAYINNSLRDSLIFKNYKKYNSKRALGFCCSRKHAEYMAKVFNKNGIPSVAVYSNADGQYSENRDTAIAELKSGKIKVIFSVNMFNEGVDIPSVDTVLFLRPTESDVVFLQQLGRGLRTSPGKEFLNVLDFIGNYKKAGKFISLLQDNNKAQADSDDRPSGNQLYSMDFPDGCFVDFDLELIDLFEQLNRSKISNAQKIRDEFYRIKDLYGKVPDRVELFTSMEPAIYDYCIRNSKDSPFKDYFLYLKNENLLTDEEKSLYNSLAKDFLHELETTSMTRSYKMPVLSAFYDKATDTIKEFLTKEDLLEAWKAFFKTNGNWKDLPNIKSYEDYKNITDKNHLDKILKNPVFFLIKSGKGLFQKGSNSPIKLNEELKPFLNNKVFAQHFKDIITYRTLDYYSRRYHEENAATYTIQDPESLMVADSGSSNS